MAFGQGVYLPQLATEIGLRMAAEAAAGQPREGVFQGDVQRCNNLAATAVALGYQEVERRHSRIVFIGTDGNPAPVPPPFPPSGLPAGVTVWADWRDTGIAGQGAGSSWTEATGRTTGSGNWNFLPEGTAADVTTFADPVSGLNLMRSGAAGRFGTSHADGASAGVVESHFVVMRRYDPNGVSRVVYDTRATASGSRSLMFHLSGNDYGVRPPSGTATLSTLQSDADRMEVSGFRIEAGTVKVWVKAMPGGAPLAESAVNDVGLVATRGRVMAATTSGGSHMDAAFGRHIILEGPMSDADMVTWVDYLAAQWVAGPR